MCHSFFSVWHGFGSFMVSGGLESTLWPHKCSRIWRTIWWSEKQRMKPQKSHCVKTSQPNCLLTNHISSKWTCDLLGCHVLIMQKLLFAQQERNCFKDSLRSCPHLGHFGIRRYYFFQLVKGLVDKQHFLALNSTLGFNTEIKLSPSNA